MAKARTKIIQVRFTEKESAMVDALSVQMYGGATRPDVIRRCIVERFNKAFPLYVQAKTGAGVPDEELTQEQICELLGGKVGRNESGATCTFIEGAARKVVPISMMGQKGITGDYRVKR